MDTLLAISVAVTLFQKSLRANQVQSAAQAVQAQAEAAQTQTVDPNVNSSDYLRSLIGLRLAPVQLTIGNRNQLLVGLGSFHATEAVAEWW